MIWIELAWMAMGSASVMLALIHLFVWATQRSQTAHLWFSTLALSVPVFGVFEILAMEASTAGDYATVSRWAQVPLFVVITSFVGFVRTYFDAGRAWLAYGTVATRALTLVLNFTTGASVLHRDITGLSHVTLWNGAVISAPIGVLSPWAVVPQVSNLFLLAFVIDASIAIWRRDGEADRRRAALVGGSLVVCIVVAAVMGVAISAGWLRSPTPLMACFFIVVLAMAYELGRDVLHAARLSKDLHESKRRIELAAEAADLAFWSWDADRDEVWITGKKRGMFEVDESASIDLDAFLDRFHPDDRGVLREAMEQALRDGAGFEREVRLGLPSNTMRWIVARGQAERDDVGAPERLRGVALDITERRRLEREAADQRDELVHLSRVAALGELSGSLAHEINQPLMGILSNAQAAQRFMAGEHPDLNEVREILVDIVEDDKRAGEVIRRLRALLRKGEIQHGELDIGQVVDDVLRVSRNDLMNRAVVPRIELARDLPPVIGDRIQLQQVLLNLVVNACDAMDGAENRELVVATRFTETNGVEVSVCDNGSGIPPADLERIFEPFVTTKSHGTGLGLSVCRTIVAAHGGRLWAENNAGGGATFRFTVPHVPDAQ
jgi:signal transduction histidine kinase